MEKELKIAVFAVLLIAASYFFGDVCERIGQGYELILSPSREILGLALRFFLAMGAVAITAGLVAALVRRQGTPVSLWARPARVFPGAASLVLFDRPRAPR